MRIIVVASFILCQVFGWSQKGITTFGLQYKPIIPNRFIGTFEQEFNSDQLESHIRQLLGHSFGGVIRHGLNKTISLETGINMTYRNFGLNFSVPDSGYTATSDVTVVSYEIPVSCLIYIQLGKQFFMNTSLGSALTLFPSNVFKSIWIQGTESFRMEGAYKHKVQGALIANFGFEYRTRSSGYFYLGTSYHLPYSPIITKALSYEHPPGQSLSIQNVRGSYLTLDLRYFFNEKKED